MRWLLKSGLLLAATLITSVASGQNIYKLWDNVYQGDWTYDGIFLQMEKAGDDQLIIASYSTSDSGYDKTMPYFPPFAAASWIIMMDANGNKKWDRDFYGALFTRGLSVMDKNTILMTADIGSSYVGGDVTAPLTPGTGGGSGIYGIWIVAFDTTGTILWNKRFGGGTDTTTVPVPVNGGYAISTDVKAVNGSIYVSGRAVVADSIYGGDLEITNCPFISNIGMPPFRPKDMLFYKVNPTDTLTNEWNRMYGGDSVDWATSIMPMSTGGFLLGGITTSQASCNQTVSAYQSPYYDFYVLHLDTFGNIIWQQRYGGSKNDWLNGIIDAGNNEYLLYGRTLSPMSYDVSTNGYNDTSLWMVMIDSAGNKLWDKRYGSCVGFDFLGPTFNEPTYGANTVDGISTSDGGFLFVSNIKDSLPCGDVSEAGKGLEDYWMLKLDHAGYKQWDKRFGGPGRDVAQQVVEMSPGYYIIGGYSKGLNTAERAIGGDKSEITIGVYDIWMVGVVDSEAVVAVHEMEEKSFEFNIYPNPAGDEVTISITPGPSSPVEKGNAKFSVYIYEITGKQQLHQVLPSIALAKDGNTSPPINISTLSSGIYIVEVRDEKGFAERKKLVKD